MRFLLKGYLFLGEKDCFVVPAKNVVTPRNDNMYIFFKEVMSLRGSPADRGVDSATEAIPLPKFILINFWRP